MLPSWPYGEPRQYQLVATVTFEQEGWNVQVRRRLKGKMAGKLYKVWVSPKGVQYYSMKEAVKNGFSDPQNKLGKMMKSLTDADKKK